MGTGTSSGKGGAPITTETLRGAFQSMKTASGFLGSDNIQKGADALDKIAQGVRIEIKNNPAANVADYYEKDSQGWIHSHVVNGALTRQTRIGSANQTVISMVQQGILQHPNRMRVVR